MRLLPPLLALLAFASPASAQEREWTLDTNSESEAFMTYGVPYTEDVGLSLWCKLGSKQLNIYVPRSGWAAGSAKQVDLKIAAAPADAVVKAKLQDEGARGGTSLEATIATDTPLAKALPDAKHVDIDTGKHKVIVPLYDAPVSGLIRLCDAK